MMNKRVVLIWWAEADDDRLGRRLWVLAAKASLFLLSYESVVSSINLCCPFLVDWTCYQSGVELLIVLQLVASYHICYYLFFKKQKIEK